MQRHLYSMVRTKMVEAIRPADCVTVWHFASRELEPCQCIVYSVERLYCKRPILCLASSKILTPRPLTAWRVTPAFGARGGHTRWVESRVVNVITNPRNYA